MKPYKPSWNRDVSPYLSVDEVEPQIAFIEKVFGAEVIEAPKMKGKVFHAELKLGDSVIMIGRAQPPDWPANKSVVYVYVPDVQKIYDRAMEAGAKSIMAPTETAWGNIDSGFDDPFGNRWFVARLVKPMTEDEITAAMAER